MNRRRTVFPWFLLPLLVPALACDPEYNLCVVTTSCADGRPIPAHVKMQAYAVDGDTDAGGKLCHQELNFPKPFDIEVDAPAFQPKTEGPFQLGAPATADFQATVCLDPAP